VLATIGGVLGLLLAYFEAGALIRILTSGRPIIGLPQPLEISLTPDGHVLLFTAATAVLTGLLFGIVPGWYGWRSAHAFSLRAVGRFREPGLRHFGKTLVISQFGLSVELLSAAGLFVSHLSNLQQVDLGFRRDHVLLVTLNPSHTGYGRDASG